MTSGSDALPSFDERTVVDLGRTHGWTNRKITGYLGHAVLGALGRDAAG